MAIEDSRAGQRALRAACAMLRLYFMHAPGVAAKGWVWRHLVRPYIIWRKLRIEAVTHFGARMEGAFPDLVHGHVYFFGIWEPGVTAVYNTALKPGDTVIDIGANVGMHTLLAAHLVGATGRVHAIEASPWIFERLARNLARNGAMQVQAHNLAATDVPGTVPVFLHPDHNLGGTTIIAAEALRTGAQHETSVEGRPLAEILPMEDILAARLIKIDVEGAEWLVLQGMRGLLPRLRQDAEILLEMNPEALRALGGSVAGVMEMFSGAGFAAFEVANDYDCSFYVTPPPLPKPWVSKETGMTDLLFRRIQKA